MSEKSTEATEYDDLAERGNITSDEYRRAITCRDCRDTWYGRRHRAESYCPNCGSRNVGENDRLPGAILLNPGVEWPEDDPFVGGDED